jgi:hypothetical protein
VIRQLVETAAPEIFEKIIADAQARDADARALYLR